MPTREQEGAGRSSRAVAERGTTMPGVDFETVRREITMEQVLDLLGFAALDTIGGAMVRELSVARVPVGPSPLVLGERGAGPLLLPWVPQSRQPA